MSIQQQQQQEQQQHEQQPLLIPSTYNDSVIEDEESYGEGTEWTALALLLSTMLGAGCISLPLAFSYLGIVMSILAMIGVAFLSDISLVMLIRSSHHARSTSFVVIGERLYGIWGRRIVQVVLLALLFGAVIVCAVVFADNLQCCLLQWLGCKRDLTCSNGSHVPWYTNNGFLISILMLTVFPLTLMRTVTALKYTSALAVLSVIYIALALGIRFFMNSHDVAHSVHAVVLNRRSLLALSMISLSFLAQFQVLPILNDMSSYRCRQNMERVVHVATVLALLIYIFIGLIGYLYFGKHVEGNILDSFYGDRVMDVARIALSIVMWCKLPLAALPFRDTTNEIFSYNRFIPLQMAILLLSCGLLAWAMDNVSKAFSIFGSTVGVTICYVIPALFFYRVSSASFQSHKRSYCGQIVSICMLLFALFLGPAGVYVTIATWNN